MTGRPGARPRQPDRVSHPSPSPAPSLVPRTRRPPCRRTASSSFRCRSASTGCGWSTSSTPNSAYSLPVLWRVAGGLDPAILEKALNEIVRRHEILRTTFSSRNGELVQVIFPEARLRLPFVDLSSLPEPEREARALKQATRGEPAALRPRPGSPVPGAPVAHRQPRSPASAQHAPHRRRRLVGRRADSGARRALRRVRPSRDPRHCRTCPSSTRTSPSGSANGARKAVFEEHARFWKAALAGAPSGPRTADGPTAARAPDVRRRLRGGALPVRSDGPGQGALAPRGRHALHDAARGVFRDPPPAHGPDGSRRRLAHRQPESARVRAPHRALHQHARPARRPFGRPDVPRAPGQGPARMSGRLRASGPALREAGRGIEPGANPRVTHRSFR